ncbi:MAG TPA: hypothetical protein P5116_08410 [Eubacteriales bacterium]|nr:hypothetical protein [Clostridia bacterium]HRV73880.1 hypothetical protein [Eubacteriales bacterium]
MDNIKMMHGNPDRAKNQKVVYETEDGRFRYQLDMDYCKELPKDLRLMPYMGAVSGGFCDAEDNLYVIFRGCAVWLTHGPKSSLVKLDPDGKYIKRIGEGKLGGGDCLHFGNVTAEGTILLATFKDQQVIEMNDEGEIIGAIGKKGEYNEAGLDDDRNNVILSRIHNGIQPTEPFFGMAFGAYEQMMVFNDLEYCEKPFYNPNAVATDSKGNIFVSDGYCNFAIHKFDRQYKLLKTFGGKGVYDAYTDTPGKFVVPHAICVDANDNVWLCDREKDAVHIFDNDGNCIAYCSHDLSQPSGIDTDGRYVYVIGRGGYLTIFDLDFNIVGELGFFNDSLRAHDLAADSKGNLYLFPTRANFEHQVIALKRLD